MVGFTNQKHIRNHRYDTVTLAETGSSNAKNTDVCFVFETKKTYYYEHGSTASVDGLTVLDANGGSGRWLSITKNTRYYGEYKTVTDGSPTLPALDNLGSHGTVKVINLAVYLNGIRQRHGAGNDYTYNETSGVITFEFNLVGNDVVLVDYDSQDA